MKPAPRLLAVALLLALPIAWDAARTQVCPHHAAATAEATSHAHHAADPGSDSDESPGTCVCPGPCHAGGAFAPSDLGAATPAFALGAPAPPPASPAELLLAPLAYVLPYPNGPPPPRDSQRWT